MSVSSKISLITSGSRPLIAGLLLLQSLSIPARADDGDREILNQLYHDIIGASQVAKTIAPDSGMPLAGARASVPSTTAPADEQLKNEIEKIMQEVEARHDAAVKFMLEAR